MRIYAVIGGWSYEGESLDSLQLFKNEEKALEYKRSLTTVISDPEPHARYDYAKITVRVLNTDEPDIDTDDE